jgi:hypothetical protein
MATTVVNQVCTRNVFLLRLDLTRLERVLDLPFTTTRSSKLDLGLVALEAALAATQAAVRRAA